MSDVIASLPTRVHAQRLGRTAITRDDVDGGANMAMLAVQAGSRCWDTDHTARGPVRSAPLSRFATANLAAAPTLSPAVSHQDGADLTKVEAFRRTLRREAEGAGAPVIDMWGMICTAAL